MKYGYLRVSTTDKQEFTRQEYVLKDYYIDQYFEEKISGTKKATCRPEFEKMLSVIQSGDEVYFESMSRMARSMQDLIDTTNYLVNKRKVKVVFIKENLTIGGEGMDAMGALVFNIMGAFAQFERDLIADRTKQALRAKMQDPEFKIGRPTTIDDEQRKEILLLYGKGCRKCDIATKLGISRASVTRLLKGCA